MLLLFNKFSFIHHFHLMVLKLIFPSTKLFEKFVLSLIEKRYFERKKKRQWWSIQPVVFLQINQNRILYLVSIFKEFILSRRLKVQYVCFVLIWNIQKSIDKFISSSINIIYQKKHLVVFNINGNLEKFILKTLISLLIVWFFILS